MNHTPHDSLLEFLSDLYSMELQADAQLDSAPDLAVDPELARAFRTHRTETERQIERVHRRLSELGGSTSAVKDAIMKLGGKGFVLFARMQTETPGRLVAHAYAYEAMEWAGYGVLTAMAEFTGDRATEEMASDIQAEEGTMMQRLERGFDAAESVSHLGTPPDQLPDHVRKHLAEIHAFEAQSHELLSRGAEHGGDPDLDEVYREHLHETKEQMRRVEQRLEMLGADRSIIQDAAMKLGGLNWSLFFRMQDDTPCKLLAFSYAVEHLEVAAYELLLRTARRAGDRATVQLCEFHLDEERAMAERLANHIDESVRVTLAAATHK